MSVSHKFYKRIECLLKIGPFGCFKVTYRAHPNFSAEITLEVNFAGGASDSNSFPCGDLFVDINVSHDSIQDVEERHNYERAEAFIYAYQDAVRLARMIEGKCLDRPIGFEEALKFVFWDTVPEHSNTPEEDSYYLVLETPFQLG